MESGTKLTKLRAAWTARERVGALCIAARLPELGDDAKLIRRVWKCAAGRGKLYSGIRYGRPRGDL
jgi:hypothetical protein